MCACWSCEWCLHNYFFTCIVTNSKSFSIPFDAYKLHHVYACLLCICPYHYLLLKQIDGWDHYTQYLASKLIGMYMTLSLQQWNKNCWMDNGIVKISIGWCVDGMWWTNNWWAITMSQTKWRSSSTCFILEWKTNWLLMTQCLSYHTKWQEELLEIPWALEENPPTQIQRRC